MKALEWAADCLRRLFPHQPLGRQGENAAARFLRQRGYKILARGDRLEWGELDLVALDQETVVFVEVKTRRGDAGHPAEAVDAVKQQRLTRLALAWLKRHGLLERPARFDVIAITAKDGCRSPVIQHFPNAFDAVGNWQYYG